MADRVMPVSDADFSKLQNEVARLRAELDRLLQNGLRIALTENLFAGTGTDPHAARADHT